VSPEWNVEPAPGLGVYPPTGIGAAGVVDEVGRGAVGDCMADGKEGFDGEVEVGPAGGGEPGDVG